MKVKLRRHTAEPFMLLGVAAFCFLFFSLPSHNLEPNILPGAKHEGTQLTGYSYLCGFKILKVSIYEY